MKKVIIAIVAVAVATLGLSFASPANAAKGPKQVGVYEILNTFWKENYDKKDRKIYCNTVRMSKMRGDFVAYPDYKINRTVAYFQDNLVGDYDYINYVLSQKYDGFFNVNKLPNEKQAQKFTNKKCKKVN